MKKFFEYIGLLCVLSFSFFVTDKTINVTRNMDNIMLKINEDKDLYLVNKIDEKILDNTIVPGINGLKVNVDESYKNMKSIGVYNPNLYIYDTIKVENELKNNLDKYIISGNKNKKMVSIFVFFNDIKVEEFLTKIGDTKINFIINYNNLENNYDEILMLIQNGHNILLDNSNDKNINKTKVILSDLGVKKLYCYNPQKDEIFLNNCSLNNFYTISIDSSEVIYNNYLSNVKKTLESGSFIILDGNLITDIPNIINYIESKGLKIGNLDNHIDENI